MLLGVFFLGTRWQRVCAPNGEEVFLVGTRIGHSFQDAGERVGEEEGEDELDWAKRSELAESVLVVRNLLFGSEAWEGRTLISASADLVGQVGESYKRTRTRQRICSCRSIAQDVPYEHL